ncbi:phage tail tip lysozyme [Lactococcus lactis]
MKKIKRKFLFACLPLGLVSLVFIVLLFLILGGGASFQVMMNTPANVPSGTLATAQAIVKRIKVEAPGATNNGIAAVLGCFQAESGDNPKRAEGDFLPYPVGAGNQPDDKTYSNSTWSSLGGTAIYGADSSFAPNIQERGLGLGQYTNERNLALQAYAKSVGKPWWDLATQLDYILKVDGDCVLLKQLLCETGDVPSITKDVVARYEQGGATGLALRIAYAQAWSNWLLNSNNQSSSVRAKGTIASLNALIGQQVGDGQCYALSSWYVQQISGFRLQGMSASMIGSDNRLSFQRSGWTVIDHPQANDLKVGAILCWKTGSNSNSIYGHTAIVNSVNGADFTTYDQNWNGNQTVELYSKMWDDSMTFVILPPQK